MKILLKLLTHVTFLRRELIYRTAIKHLGTDASPFDEVPDEYACVSSLTKLLMKAQVWPTHETGTYSFWERLNQSKHWVPTNFPETGDIALAVTGKGFAGTIGHCWILGKNNVYMSNDSATGKWMANYTSQTVHQKYTVEKGMKIYYYTYKA